MAAVVSRILCDRLDPECIQESIQLQSEFSVGFQSTSADNRNVDVPGESPKRLWSKRSPRFTALVEG